MYSKAAICLGLLAALMQVSDARSLHKSSGRPRVGSCVSNDQCPSSYFCHSEYRCCPCVSCSEANRIAGVECAKDVRGCGSCSGSLDPSLEDSGALGQDGGSSGVGICRESDQCASGYFCHSDYKCHPCFDCSGANRAPGEGCAPDASRCGSYLDRHKINNIEILSGTNNTTTYSTATWIEGENSESTNYRNIMKTTNLSDLYKQPTDANFEAATYMFWTMAFVPTLVLIIIIVIIRIIKKNRLASTNSSVPEELTNGDEECELVTVRNENGTASGRRTTLEKRS